MIDVLGQVRRVALVVEVLRWPSADLRSLVVRIVDELEARRVDDLVEVNAWLERAA